MLTFLAIATAGFAAYGPPTNEDAFTAYIAPILLPVRETGDVIREAELHFRPDFPADLNLQHCVRKENHKVNLGDGIVGYFGGYDCIFEVWPHGEPAFRTSGFFHYDGFEWVFYGPVKRSQIPSPEAFDPIRDKGRFDTKPGSLTYDGDPRNPVNPSYTPYEDFFEETDPDGEIIYY